MNDDVQVQDRKCQRWGHWTEKVVNTSPPVHALPSFTVWTDTNPR